MTPDRPIELCFLMSLRCDQRVVHHGGLDGRIPDWTSGEISECAPKFPAFCGPR